MLTEFLTSIYRRHHSSIEPQSRQWFMGTDPRLINPSDPWPMTHPV